MTSCLSRVLLTSFALLHGRMARGGETGHGLPKVLPGPATPNPSTPCREATPKTDVSWVARPQGRWASSTLSDIPRRTPMLFFRFELDFFVVDLEDIGMDGYKFSQTDLKVGMGRIKTYSFSTSKFKIC
jgi:hypothetical protein